MLHTFHFNHQNGPIDSYVRKRPLVKFLIPALEDNGGAEKNERNKLGLTLLQLGNI